MTFQHISIEEAKVLIDSEEVTLVDVRDASAHGSAHIPKSVNISDANVEEFVASADKSKPMIVYCYGGNMSQGAADYFFNQGYETVYSMDGGFEAWRQKY